MSYTKSDHKTLNRDSNLRADGQARSFREPRPRRTALEIYIDNLARQVGFARLLVRDAEELGRLAGEETQKRIAWIEYALVKLEIYRAQAAQAAAKKAARAARKEGQVSGC